MRGNFPDFVNIREDIVVFLCYPSGEKAKKNCSPNLAKELYMVLQIIEISTSYCLIMMSKSGDNNQKPLGD